MSIHHRKRRLERGAAAVEYALVVGLISLVIVAITVGFGARFGEYTVALVDHVGQLLG